MSVRGVIYDYIAGECVLCFEPDPTKARVLYDAKVLETTIRRDKYGRRAPGYLIHFQGWNNSWDRVVGEHHILKNTEENRILMKRLAEIARKYRVNRTRKKRIDEILRKAFDGPSTIHASDSGSDSGSDSSDEDEEEDGSENREEETDENPISEMGDTEENGQLHDNDSNIVYLKHRKVLDTEKVGSESDAASSSGSGHSEDKRKKHIEFELDLPDILKEKLDMDYFAVNQEEKLVKLPVEPNIITILEGFVKTFSVNLLCHTVDKHRSNKDEPRIPFNRNIPLCKELADGLRICFDFTLPLILLYAAEKDQHKKVSATYKNKSPIKKDIDSISQSVPSSPTPSPSPTRLRSLRFSISSTDEPSSKVQRLSSPRPIRKEKVENDSMPKLEETPPLTPRRLTRQAFHERKSVDTVKFPMASLNQDKKDEDKKEPRRFELRSGRRHSESSPTVTSLKREVSLSSEGDSSDQERSTPPPPLLIPSAISSHNKHNNSQTTTNSINSSAEVDKEDIVDSVLTWKLLPPDIIDQVPSAPSLIYGAQHLLRLFVKLPDLIKKMNMPEKKLKALLKLNNSFLQYLAEREEELFPDSVYVSAEEAVL